jgi:Fanconi anemia group M protein
MRFVEHPLIKEKTIEARLYQEVILNKAIASDLLCVLPTGLGKTPIAIMLTAYRLTKYPDSKVLVMAPTKPLTEQHFETFKKTLKISEDSLFLITGKIKPKKREELYNKAKIIFATPQTIENDLKENRISLSDFSLLVFDEAHHSIGAYSYPYIAKVYVSSAKNPRILALTASPGGTKTKIKEIMDNLGIKEVEIRTEKDADVKPWIKEKRMGWVYVSLPEDFIKIRDYLKEAYKERVEKLKKIGFSKPTRLVTKKDLLELQKKLSEEEGCIKFFGASIVSQAIKLEHALSLLETQGITSLENYFKKLFQDKTKSSRSILKDKNVEMAMKLSSHLASKGYKHPKMGKLCEIVSEELRKKSEAKIIIFANYRETVKEIAKTLSFIENAKPVEFMGQKEGMTQKEQKIRIQQFKEGKYNILVATSIGEEGIDIPEVELAVFYEPVPSEIRSIQRRGRVGRTKIGRVIILIAKRTRDEAYYWTAHKKEKIMRRTLYEIKESEMLTEDLQESLEIVSKKVKKQKSLSDFG